MPGEVYSRWFTVHGLKKSMNYELKIKNQFGYTLIELLIVIAIFGITISIVTASYLTFERNQRFKNAALQLKSDLRYTQNKALTGDKSQASCLRPGAVLVGWYLAVSYDASSGGGYSIYSDCGILNSDNTVSSEVVDALSPEPRVLPRDVRICDVTDNGVSKNPGVNVFFQTILPQAVFFQIGSSLPPFMNSAVLKSTTLSGPVEVYLQSSTTTCHGVGTYRVIIQTTGEINEAKL